MIEVDGGVGPQHVEECLDAGVDVFVAGTSYYKSNPQGAIRFCPLCWGGRCLVEKAAYRNVGCQD